jgi:hypothetical protein
MNSTTVNLCTDLSLSISLDGQEITIRLRDDMTLNETRLCYPLTQTAISRYRIQEGLVIAMRRLISQAVQAGLISDSPGTPATLSSSIAEPVSDQDTQFTLSGIDLEL